jgi:hypothetical protein
MAVVDSKAKRSLPASVTRQGAAENQSCDGSLRCLLVEVVGRVLSELSCYSVNAVPLCFGCASRHDGTK